ncbi:MAG TPA: hypothetical protein VIP09_05565 [Dehalococcoidia bacterium]|jgi:succinyl-CoA synthetase beta subunit
MRFYEFEAKKLLAKQGVRLPAGGTAKTPGEARKLASEVGGPPSTLPAHPAKRER